MLQPIKTLIQASYIIEYLITDKNLPNQNKFGYTID